MSEVIKTAALTNLAESTSTSRHYMQGAIHTDITCGHAEVINAQQQLPQGALNVRGDLPLLLSHQADHRQERLR